MQAYSEPSKQELLRVFQQIMVKCTQIGFYVCQNEEFEGINRGEFLIPIEMQRLNNTEKEFDKFLGSRYSDKLDISMFKFSANLNINTSKRFDLEPYSKITHMQILNKDASIIRVDFKEVDSVALVKRNGSYKLGVLPEEHDNFIKSKRMNNVRVLRLKNNILRYHMKEAELLNYDIATLDSKISHALAPIIEKVYPEEVPAAIKVFIKRDINEVSRFYWGLNSEGAIIKKLKSEHPGKL